MSYKYEERISEEANTFRITVDCPDGGQFNNEVLWNG